MYRIAPLLVISMIGVSAAAEPADVRGTIDRGLAFLAQEAVAWKEERKCASCHHVPMGIWSLNEARNRGYAVDEQALADLTAWVLDPTDPGRLFPAQAPSEENPAQTPDEENPVQASGDEIIVNQSPLMLALGMSAGDWKDDATRVGLRKLLTTALEQQRPDGSWGLLYLWEPFGPAPDVTTSWVVLSLSSPAAAELLPEATAARDKGWAWLAAAEDSPQLQSMAMELLVARRLGRPEEEWNSIVAQIVGRQRPDGGWSQEDGLDSDAYSTGLALYVLAEAGAAAEGAALAKGQEYLVKTQLADGSWPMSSRPGGPRSQSASDTGPIAYVGTAWAVMGLVRTAPSDTPSLETP